MVAAVPLPLGDGDERFEPNCKGVLDGGASPLILQEGCELF